MAKILGGTERQRTRAFLELQSHYLLDDKFGRPAKGNDKGKVEGLVGYVRGNFMVPVPRYPSWEAFNEHLEQRCRRRRERRLRGHTETIGERFEQDRAALLPLPIAPYKACETEATRWPWCGITATTTPCRPATGIFRCWCVATSMK